MVYNHNFELNRNYVPLCTFYSETKMSENKVALLDSNSINIFTFNNNAIFKNKEYYNGKINFNDKSSEKFRVVKLDGKYLDFIPIYKTNKEKKLVKNHLTLTFKATLNYENLIRHLQLRPPGNIDHIKSDIISNKLVLLNNSNNIFVDQAQYKSNFSNYCIEKNMPDKIYIAKNKIVISVEIGQYDRDFALISKFEFNLPRSELCFLIRSQIVDFVTVYIYSKNLFVIFTE